MNEAICVHLYGDGSRNNRLRAEYIYCDKANECSACKQGKCLCVTEPFSSRCPVGNVETIDGGTKRSKMFTKVKNSVKSDPNYGVLQYSSNLKIVRIGDDAVLSLAYVRLKIENDVLKVDGPWGSGSKILFVPKEIFTADNVLNICKCKPMALMGGEIDSYQNDEVPMFLRQLRELFPEVYVELIAKSPSQENKVPHFIGKQAKLLTLKPNCEYKTMHGKFFFDGKYAYFDNYNTAFKPFWKCGNMSAKVEVTNDTVVTVSDNEQVLETTEFV